MVLRQRVQLNTREYNLRLRLDSSVRYNLFIRYTHCILLRGRADELAEDAGEILFIGGKADGFSQLCHF